MRSSAPGTWRRICAKAASPRALSRPTSTRRAPMAARRSAATKPMPDVAPVMTQIFPFMPRAYSIRYPRTSTLAIEDVEAAGDDDDGAEPSRRIREFAEREIADDHRADELAIVERRDDGRRSPFQRLDDEIMAEAAKNPEAGKQKKIEKRAGRLPNEGEHQARKCKSNDGDIGVRGLCRDARGQAARQDLIERVAGGADQHQEGREVDHARPGPQDEEGSEEANGNRRPSLRTHLLAQHDAREGRGNE